MDVVRGGVKLDEVVMGVLGMPMDPIPEREAGEDFGADPISDKLGDPCRCACNGVLSIEGTAVPAGDVTEEVADVAGFP